MKRLLLILCLSSIASPLWATDYHVGPSQAYTNIVDVPWQTLTSGDTVYIHWRSTPYYEKFLISGVGTLSEPIRVVGVLEGGKRPIISGENAVSGSNYWPAHSILYGAEDNSVINITARVASEIDKYNNALASPRQQSYIEISNLEVTGITIGASFTDSSGTANTYTTFPSCISAHQVDHITISNSVFHGCGNGIFMAPNGDGGVSDVKLIGNTFYDFGVSDPNAGIHASYIESDKVIYEGNYFIGARTGSTASAIKDRSAGTVIRYNYFVRAPGRTLDLVETENSAYYGYDYQLNGYYLQTFVYGNIFWTPPASGTHGSLIHYGADNAPDIARTTLGGTLYFYHNTVLETGFVSGYYDFSTLDTAAGGGAVPTGSFGYIDYRNNAFYLLNAPYSPMYMTRDNSENFILGANAWSVSWEWQKSSVETPTSVTGLENVFSPVDNNFGFSDPTSGSPALQSGSPLIGAASALPGAISTNTLGQDLTPTQEYQSVGVLVSRNSLADIGAVSYSGTIDPPAGQLTNTHATFKPGNTHATRKAGNTAATIQ